jgi:hypothetical protein
MKPGIKIMPLDATSLCAFQSPITNNTNMAEVRIAEVEAALAPFSIGLCNFVTADRRKIRNSIKIINL